MTMRLRGGGRIKAIPVSPASSAVPGSWLARKQAAAGERMMTA